MVELFKDNEDVKFGDVNLAEDGVREAFGTPQNPGAGGWPTIRYYNKETGYGGAPYTKKTDKAMCEELKDIQYMQAYVEEAGSTALCNVETRKGCSAKAGEFVDKWQGKTADEIQAEHKRLSGMDPNSMTGDKKAWMMQRQTLLKQLAKTGGAEL